MNFSDIFKKSFIESFTAVEFTPKTIILVFVISSIFSLYIFFSYRIMTRKTFYDKQFAISLAASTVIVASIILTIQSSIVISLGMVGALSIVRFRTAIKNSLDLIFMFWSISVGIICGAGLPGIAFTLCLVITVGCFILNLIPTINDSKILVINANNLEIKKEIIEILDKQANSYDIKSETVSNGLLSIVIELRLKKDNNLIYSLNQVKGITRCSLLSHDGEITY